MIIILKALLGVFASIFSFFYIKDLTNNRKTYSNKSWLGLSFTGFITNFLDTLGIGSFAQQTVIFKFFKFVDDRLIPGTMNVGNLIPTVVQAFIFMTAVEVDSITIFSISASTAFGALFGAGIVSKMSRSKIQLGMGIGLMIVAFIILAGFFKMMPVGGVAVGLTGWKLFLIIFLSVILGALQTIGIGFYAPCMAMIYALGMHPLTAFPIMMTATAMLMLSGGFRFMKENAYDRKTSLALTIAGTIGVFLAAYVVKSLPLQVLKGVVCGVVMYTSIWMFKSALSKES